MTWELRTFNLLLKKLLKFFLWSSANSSAIILLTYRFVLQKNGNLSGISSLQNEAGEPSVFYLEVIPGWNGLKSVNGEPVGKFTTSYFLKHKFYNLLWLRSELNVSKNISVDDQIALAIILIIIVMDIYNILMNLNGIWVPFHRQLYS